MNSMERQLFKTLLWSMEKECLEEYEQKLCQVINDDEVRDDLLLKILFGELHIEENSDLAEGVQSTESRAEEIRNQFNADERRSKNSHWLLLSCPTTNIEMQQRELEIDYFIKTFCVPSQRYERQIVTDVGELFIYTSSYLEKHFQTNYHLNIVILGHGCVRTGFNSAQKSGVLASKAVPDLKVYINSEDIAKVVKDRLIELTKQHSERRDGHVHLCLFYCYAQESTYPVQNEDFRIILYKNGQRNPWSAKKPNETGDGFLSSENMALTWLETDFRDAQEGQPCELQHNEEISVKQQPRFPDLENIPLDNSTREYSLEQEYTDTRLSTADSDDDIAFRQSSRENLSPKLCEGLDYQEPNSIPVKAVPDSSKRSHRPVPTHTRAATDTPVDETTNSESIQKPLVDSPTPNIDYVDFATSLPWWQRLWQWLCDHLPG